MRHVQDIPDDWLHCQRFGGGSRPTDPEGTLNIRTLLSTLSSDEKKKHSWVVGAFGWFPLWLNETDMIRQRSPAADAIRGGTSVTSRSFHPKQRAKTGHTEQSSVVLVSCVLLDFTNWIGDRCVKALENNHAE